MISDNERREVAARLRANHRLDRENQVTFIARMVKGSDTVTASYVCRLPERLADLIDRPTCTIVCECDACSSLGERIDEMRLYELSCGHQAVGFNKPGYCPKCGVMITDAKR